MNLSQLLSQAKDQLATHAMGDGVHCVGVRNLRLLQTSAAKFKSCSVLEPLISLVLQGNKTAQFGTQQVDYMPGSAVVVGQSLPVVSSVINATPDIPFIAMYIGIDMPVLRSVYSDMGGVAYDETTRAVATGKADAELIEAVARLFRLHRDPVEERTLGAAALREVYFRVLRSQHGQALRQVIHHDSKANQIAKAIVHIRQEYRSTIKAADLASIAGMSASVFYETFKQVTASSPLQYQKDLRLVEAHQMLMQAQAPVSEIAHRVGYESPAQFSREFSRKFGAPPRSFVGAMPA